MRKGDQVNWSRDAKHASQVGKAKAIYGDGPFWINAVLPGDFDPSYNGAYLELVDQKGSIVMRDEKSFAMFEEYLFELA